CDKALKSPAGIIFVEQDGDLRMVSQWRSRQTPKKHLDEEIIKRGPVARAFRTGQPVVCRDGRGPRSTAAIYLHRLIRRCSGGNVVFLPIKVPEQRPIGVLGIVLPQTDGRAQGAYDDLATLGPIVSGCFARARAYDESLAARSRAEDVLQSTDE